MYKEVFDLHSKLLKAIAHPKRLEIIHLLRGQKMCVGQIYEMLDLPQANVSQHLMILRDAGVVNFKKNGKNVYYSLAHRNFSKASDQIREVLIERYQKSPIEKEFLKEMKELVPLVHDPVCKMRLSPKTAGFAYKLDGIKYYFCASGCLDKFKKNPASYI